MESESYSLEIIMICVSLVLSGFFSASETALTSLTELKVKHLLEEKGKRAESLKLWLRHPNKVLNTILLGNNIVNIFASVLAADLATKMFGNSRIGIVTGVMTVMVLIFGEITPKTFAKHNAVGFAIMSIKFLRVLFVLFYPATVFMNLVAKWLIRISGGSIDRTGPQITGDELEFMINVGGQEGVLEFEQKEMLQNIFEIGDIYAKEVMVPRTEMVAVPANVTFEELMEVMRSTEFSRIPVYEGRLDNVIGILYTKDVLKLVDRSFTLSDIMGNLREASFVPETKRIDDLLREFQSNRKHMAVVVDEYGGVSGIVTMEDILEEIVGEIWDEYDEAEEMIVQHNDDTYIIDAMMDVDDFCKKFNVERTEEMQEYETLGGLVFDLAGKIPEVGDSFEFGGFRFEVTEIENRKLEKIKLTLLQEQLIEEV